jgi:hypothetical protein
VHQPNITILIKQTPTYIPNAKSASAQNMQYIPTGAKPNYNST